MSSLTRIAVLTGVAALGYYAARGARSSLRTGWQRHMGDGAGASTAMGGGDGMAATPLNTGASSAGRSGGSSGSGKTGGSNNAGSSGSGGSTGSTGSRGAGGSQAGSSQAGSSASGGGSLAGGAAGGSLNAGEALQRNSRPEMGFPTRDSNDGKGVSPGLGDYARGA